MFEKLTSIFPKRAISSVQNTLENVNPMESLSTNQKKDLESGLSKLTNYIIYAVLFVTPLSFAPFLADAFDLPRLTLLFALVFLASAAFVLRLLTTSRSAIFRSIFDLPIFALMVVTFAAALLSVNKFSALASDPILYLTLTLLFMLLYQVISKENLLVASVKTLLTSGAVLGFWSGVEMLYHFFGSNIALPANLAVYFSTNFSPAGSALSQAIFLALLLPIAISLLCQTLKKKETIAVTGLLSGLIIVGLVCGLYTLFQNRPIVLPLDTGWKIATGTIGQSLTSAFVGVGPSHFIDSFTLYKPIEFNNSLLWNLRFVTSSNLLFYLLTTTGIFGLSAFLWLTISLLQTAKKRLDTNLTSILEKGLIGSLVLALVSFVVLPTPQISLFTFFVVLALFVSNLRLSGNTKYVFDNTEKFNDSGWQKPAIALIILAGLISGGYFLTRLVLADYHFAKSLQAAAANRGTETYNEQIAALQLNPWNENYRVSYSQTNLALANALAAQPNLTDQQKQTVLALVQQSIREGRNAVSLEPRRAGDWENLSIIYRNLINFAQGADQFAIATQNQAITFDPTNPRLRLDLGGIYFSLKDFQSAGQTFAQAVTLKPDYANAHYNLAQAMKELKLNSQAVQQLQATATLVCGSPQSADCKKVNAEIAALGGEQAASPSAVPTLTTPLATAAGQTNLPKAATKPPAKISSPSGELGQ